jgi:hypothetical protein
LATVGVVYVWRVGLAGVLVGVLAAVLARGAGGWCWRALRMCVAEVAAVVTCLLNRCDSKKIGLLKKYR